MSVPHTDRFAYSYVIHYQDPLPYGQVTLNADVETRFARQAAFSALTDAEKNRVALESTKTTATVTAKLN